MSLNSLDLFEDAKKVNVELHVAEIFPKLKPDQKQVILEELQLRAIKKARNDFYTYVQLMAPSILPEGFINGKHIKIMAEALQKVERAVARNRPTRLNIALAPGAMKSRTLNLFISWCLGRHPNWFILHVGHGTQFVEDNAGRPIRDFIRSPEYKTVFPYTELKQDSRAAGRWETTEKGTYYAAGAGASIAGRRAHLVICDDVLSEQSAMSDSERKGILAWYGPGVRTRLLPSGSEVMVSTRWRIDDLTGYLIEGDKHSKIPWKTISIPAIITKESEAEFLGVPLVDLTEEQSKILGGLKRANSFWPEFQKLDWLLQKKLDPGLTEARWNALYMQTPVPEEGNIIKEADFKLWKESDPPPLDLILVTMDTAFSTKTSADFSAYGVWGIFNQTEKDIKGGEFICSNIILLECGKARWEFPDLLNKTHEIYDAYKPDTIVVEKKASGQCYDDKTEVLTDTGWKFFKDIDIKQDKFATRNIQTKKFEWQKATEEIHDKYNGDMYRFEGKTHNLLVTPWHRMLVTSIPRNVPRYLGKKRKNEESFLTAEEAFLYGNEKTSTPLTSIWEGIEIINKRLEPDVFVSGKSGVDAKAIVLSGDDYIKFMAMYLSEGWTQFNKQRTYSVHIGQYEKSPHYACFYELLSKMGTVQKRRGKDFYLTNRKLYEFVRQYGLKCDTKTIPSDILNSTPRQLKLFWDWYMKGDGHKTKKGHEAITTTSYGLAGQLQEMCQKMGLSASIRKIILPQKFIKIGNNKHLSDTRIFKQAYIVRLRKSKVQRLKPTKSSYTGNIHCVTVPNGVLYVRRNGFPSWCGNSLIQELRRRGLPVAEYMPDKDKLSRAHACTPFFKAGRIWIPEGQTWAKELVSEVTQFPFGPYDDYLDVTTEAILFLRDMFAVANPKYQSELQRLEDEDGPPKKKRTTYWSLVEGRT